MDLNQVINDLREKLAKAESERDALADQVEAFYITLMNSDNISKSSKEMISGIYLCMDKSPVQCLSAHDAEVASKDVLEFAAKLLVNHKVDVIDFAKAESDQLRNKAGE